MTIINQNVPTNSSWTSRLGDTLSFIAESMAGKISEAGLGLLESQSFLGSSVSSQHPRFRCDTSTPNNLHLQQRVTHLGQRHSTPDMSTQDKKETWDSQKQIAKYLLANLDAAVFEEGITSTYLSSESYAHNLDFAAFSCLAHAA